MKDHCDQKHSKNENELREAIEEFMSQLNRPGSIRDNANKSLDSFEKRLVTCISNRGKLTDNKKMRHDAWISHQIEPASCPVYTVENQPA